MKPDNVFAIRLIVMAILGFVILMGVMLGTVFIILPSRNELEASRNIAIVCLVIAALAAMGFLKLCLDVIRAHRRGEDARNRHSETNRDSSS
jgi:hypothetical protein